MNNEEVAHAVRPGEETSEHARSRSSSTWGIVTTLLGVIVSLSPVVTELPGTAGVIGGAVIAIAGVLMKLSADLGYSNGRAAIKLAAIDAARPEPQTQGSSQQ